MTLRSVLVVMIIAAGALSSGAVQAAEKLRIGYWASGLGLAFGALLEQQKFLEKEGIEVEYVHFSDVNAPAKAVLTKNIDLAFAASALGSLALAADGAPVKIVLATQVAEGKVVALESSPYRSITDLKGKKLGTLAVGSANHALVTALLNRNYGIKPTDYEIATGSEAKLAQFLAQNEVQFAALRAITIEQVSDSTRLHPLISLVDEWQKLTASKTVPINALTIVHADFSERNPETIAKFITAARKALAYGSAHKDQVAKLLETTANLPPREAVAYANNWDGIFIADFGTDTLRAIKRLQSLFLEAGVLKAEAPESAFATQYFTKAIAVDK